MSSVPRLSTVLYGCSCIFFASSALAQTPPAGWSHAVEVFIDETSDTALTDYQVPIDIDSQTLIDAGTLRPDGADLRFELACSGAPEPAFLPYWIDAATLDTPATRVWVRVPAIPALGRTQLFMYHGNPDAVPATTLAAFRGPLSATDRVTGGAVGGVGNSQRGIRFTPNGPLFITQFGKNEPNGTTRWVTLFDYATQAKLQQIQVSGPAGEYVYADLPGIVQLQQDHDYVLQIYQGDSDGYYFGPNTSQTSEAITYRDMRYCNGCNQNTFPTNYLNLIHYGYPDMTVYWAAHRAASEVTVTFATAGTGCTETAACNADCTPAMCGDGKPNSANGEGCDDGNTDDTDACVATCKVASCGDGFVQVGVEECEDGNQDNTDACLNTCMNAYCGDGFVNPDTELCDDGNRDGGDACTNACGPATCGDGFVYQGVEECDDANTSIFDACLPSCIATHCGDGILNTATEECEDGNTRNEDACKNDCTYAFCGDGFVFGRFEGCDDGNVVPGDGCSSTCQVETAPPGPGPEPEPLPDDDDASPTPIDETVPKDDGGGCAATSASSLGTMAGLVLLGVLRRRASPPSRTTAVERP